MSSSGGGASKKSRRHTVAFQGEPGAFSEAAAKKHFDITHGESVDTQGCASFRDVFASVKDGKTEYGIVPIENSASGTLHTVYDQLLNHALYIVGECTAIEEHVLCALPGAKLESITTVLSHPAMFDQCSEFLGSIDAERASASSARLVHESHWDTAAACSKIESEQITNAAAIASREAATAHKLDILKEAVGNDKNNETRYLLVAAAPYELPELSWQSRLKMKCSVAIALANAPNALFKMVSCFGLRSLNIVKMETRPATTAGSTVFRANPKGDKGPPQSIKHWDYIFYVDFEPSWDTDVNDNLMRCLSEFSVGVRNFGTYRQNLPDVLAVHSPWHDVAELAWH